MGSNWFSNSTGRLPGFSTTEEWSPFTPSRLSLRRKSSSPKASDTSRAARRLLIRESGAFGLVGRKDNVMVDAISNGAQNPAGERIANSAGGHGETNSSCSAASVGATE